MAEGIFAIDYAHCGLWHQAEQAYQQSILAAFLIPAALGRTIGLIVTTLWGAAGLTLVILIFWHLLRAVAERL